MEAKRARDEKSPSLIISYDEDSERGKMLTAELLRVHAVGVPTGGKKSRKGRLWPALPFG
jgi:hypothetical protein